MDKINVNLYGGKSIFGGRETPLEAEMTYCDKYKNCSFYKQGKCFSAGRWQQNCKFGKKVRQKGYTSRALKYNDFRDKYRKDECYNKLDEPNNTIGKIEDTFVINVRYLHEKEGGGYEIETNIFSHPLIYINENDFKNELISLICDEKHIFCKYNYYNEKDIVKHSKQLIDLIEVKDVIKYRINNISTTLETKGYVEGIVNISDEEMLQKIKSDKNYHILEILTKESYMANCYKVGGKQWD